MCKCVTICKYIHTVLGCLLSYLSPNLNRLYKDRLVVIFISQDALHIPPEGTSASGLFRTCMIWVYVVLRRADERAADVVR